MRIYHHPQCSNGTTQSRPFPARAMKTMESARNRMSNAAPARSEDSARDPWDRIFAINQSSVKCPHGLLVFNKESLEFIRTPTWEEWQQVMEYLVLLPKDAETPPVLRSTPPQLYRPRGCAPGGLSTISTRCRMRFSRRRRRRRRSKAWRWEMGARINLESGQRLAQPLLHPRRLWNWGWDFRRCSIE